MADLLDPLVSANQISSKKQDIKYDTRDYVIDYLVNQFKEDNFYIPIEYQRQFIWKNKQKCNFIESILMGLPIPFMFFADTTDGRIEIVDGAQRTQTLVEFVENDLKLENMSVLTASNNFTFNDLDIAVRRRFLNTSIRVVFLEQGTTEKSRQEIFKRINTGGVRINSSEIRRGSFDGVFSDFLKECTKNEIFNKLAPRTEETERRYEGLELVSRFFTYYDNFSDKYFGYDGFVAKYIDNYVKKQNELITNSESPIIKEKRKIFDDMLVFAEKILGERGFRKTKKSRSTPRARFEALSVGIALALKENPNLKAKDVSKWLESDEFNNNTKSDAANNKNRLINRIVYVRDMLLR